MENSLRFLEIHRIYVGLQGTSNFLSRILKHLDQKYFRWCFPCSQNTECTAFLASYLMSWTEGDPHTKLMDF